MADGLLSLSPVIPVVVLDDAADAVPLAGALLDGGVPVMEITLRTPAALASIAAVADAVPAMTVGAGTLTTPSEVGDAVAAGARFLVSPGSPARLVDAMLATGLPALPGVATATEALALLDRGVTAMKFFPAGPAGGPRYLAALAGPLPQVRFCPTGGIGPGDVEVYLSLPNVACVGGSWLAPRDVVRRRDWAEVSARCAALRGRGGVSGDTPPAGRPRRPRTHLADAAAPARRV
ncbi:MAG: bifunctional 4-hydroxy-2-oxoglutarate aldolase/2-dehydro-3-deoxy-phosphogluconate aldolase [Pseudonocardia sp.]